LLRDAWPVRYGGPTLDAKANEVAIESIELACDDVGIES
jgi:phage tail-like protein